MGFACFGADPNSDTGFRPFSGPSDAAVDARVATDQAGGSRRNERRPTAPEAASHIKMGGMTYCRRCAGDVASWLEPSGGLVCTEEQIPCGQPAGAFGADTSECVSGY
jgi:hypothetical protein